MVNFFHIGFHLLIYMWKFTNDWGGPFLSKSFWWKSITIERDTVGTSQPLRNGNTSAAAFIYQNVWSGSDLHWSDLKPPHKLLWQTHGVYVSCSGYKESVVLWVLAGKEPAKAPDNGR